MVCKVDLPWRVNAGDLLNGSWPLAMPIVFPESPEFAPCSNPPCENITRLGYSPKSPEKRHYRVPWDPFSGYVCGVCHEFRRTHDGQLPTAQTLKGLMEVSKIRGWTNRVRGGLMPDTVIECSKEGCKAIEENNAVGRDYRFRIWHGQIYCPKHQTALSAVDRWARKSQEALSPRRKGQKGMGWFAKLTIAVSVRMDI
ncbi:hypothetical protein N7516_006473 [Penicillium verrucosum]|uniref:uncharacterized protein n=1 Tax=Penicillium verrucosum TaxID=60171 RepID=UPI002544D914|nr:uncharacterized protein N7516_006473 [Penicillium verrucosum]KAJ5931984.1 hypothetical protein N7516_006473 [Penicillium verrucosum]